jgi:hypothetical protein
MKGWAGIRSSCKRSEINLKAVEQNFVAKVELVLVQEQQAGSQ